MNRSKSSATFTHSRAKVETYTNLANELLATGKLNEAIAHYRKALSINPDHLEANGNLGVALQAQGKLDGPYYSNPISPTDTTI